MLMILVSSKEMIAAVIYIGDDVVTIWNQMINM